MATLAQLDLDRGCATIGVALAIKGLPATLADVIGVIDDPSFALLTLAGGPNALANSHEKPLRCFPIDRNNSGLLQGYPLPI